MDAFGTDVQIVTLIAEDQHHILKKKFEMNMIRDKRKVDELEQFGWRVLVIWECEVNHSLPECVSRIEKHVTSK